MNILSIHYGHDSSCCILKNGEINLYFKEERISRNKRDGIPFFSIKKCLEVFKEKITHIVISSFEYNETAVNLIKKFISIFINLPPNKNILYSNHHLSHLGISFFNSGFEEAIVVVVDGRGSSYNNEIVECESIYLMSYKNGIKTILKNYFIPTYMNFNQLQTNTRDEIMKNSYEFNIFNKTGGIVNLYSTASLLIGENPIENGKTMGLSSYGEKIKEFPHLFTNKCAKINNDYFKIYKYENGFEMPIFKQYHGKTTNKVTKENYKFYADYAHEIQIQTQEQVGNLIEKAIKETGIKKVCVSGGYGMNVVANYYYLKRFLDIEFYFEPISDDTGSSIGLAKLFWYFETKDQNIRTLKTTSFHGVHYDLSSYKGKTTSIKEIAKFLYQNKSVAVYSGLSEVGQRALGNRSILFNALNPNAKDLVNKIKKREWYRPFAAVILEEDANEYFDMGDIKSSPFMTISFPVRSEHIKTIPGVSHVDNTCRIQTVEKTHKFLYNLLQEFKKLSGHGILLNTSFNLAGEPLVETPEDAFGTLHNSSLNYLWFEETQQLFENKKYKY